MNNTLIPCLTQCQLTLGNRLVANHVVVGHLLGCYRLLELHLVLHLLLLVGEYWMLAQIVYLASILDLALNLLLLGLLWTHLNRVDSLLLVIAAYLGTIGHHGLLLHRHVHFVILLVGWRVLLRGILGVGHALVLVHVHGGTDVTPTLLLLVRILSVAV